MKSWYFEGISHSENWGYIIIAPTITLQCTVPQTKNEKKGYKTCEYIDCTADKIE